MDLVSRLKQYLDSRQISVTQFADECGIPRPTASQLLAGRNKKVSDEIIGKIHQCYPNLNVIWLMFGEGNMVTGENIETSEPQNTSFFGYSDTQNPDTQKDYNAVQSTATVEENPRENTDSMPVQHRPAYDTRQTGVASGSEFSFSPTTGDTSSTFAFRPSGQRGSSRQQPAPARTQQMRQSDTTPRPITLTPEKGKRVTGIVVYYDDSTYESFVPDPDHSIPFLR